MIQQVMSFGKMPLANGFLEKEEFLNEYFFELALQFDSESKLISLVEQPNPSKMFNEKYAFFSGTSKLMQEHFRLMAEDYFKDFLFNKSDAFLVELGCNDGIMLQNIANRGVKHLGVEPSLNVANVAKKKGINVISNFFSNSLALEIKKHYGQADVLCAANVMCHIKDLSSVAQGAFSLLKEDGVLIFEEPYMGDVINKTSYDQIYDEHVYIFSVLSVMNLFARFGFTLFHVEPQETHGGSMRYYLCKNGVKNINESVNRQIDFELALGLDKYETYLDFSEKCKNSKLNLVELLKNLKKDGKKVVGYAATSKSTTVLNYCGIGSDLIECIYDTTPIKQGKYSPGMHIPIKPYIDFENDRPDYAVLFAWNHSKEIFHKEKDFIARGGKWILFVPEVGIIETKVS